MFKSAVKDPLSLEEYKRIIDEFQENINFERDLGYTNNNSYLLLVMYSILEIMSSSFSIEEMDKKASQLLALMFLFCKNNNLKLSDCISYYNENKKKLADYFMLFSYELACVSEVTEDQKKEFINFLFRILFPKKILEENKQIIINLIQKINNE